MITVGIDEVGRGSWAGPLVAAAVILNGPILGLKDSKLITRAGREKIEARIRANAAAIGIGWVTHQEIDRLGLTKAIALAMTQAIEQIKIPYVEIIIDGNYNFLQTYPGSRTIIKADSLVPAVSAASVVAKVARDRFMIEQAKLFPNYNFDTNVGYGTRLHRERLKLHGICDLHRRSFKPIQALMV